jgi:hypothetical protein
MLVLQLLVFVFVVVPETLTSSDSFEPQWSTMEINRRKENGSLSVEDFVSLQSVSVHNDKCLQNVQGNLHSENHVINRDHKSFFLPGSTYWINDYMVTTFSSRRLFTF